MTAHPVDLTQYARRFTDLVVYQKSRLLMREVFLATKDFPAAEKYSLTDQWRRAARSIGGQIAEAWAKQRYPKHFASKLSDADGEQMESQHWTITAMDCGYITREQATRLGGLAMEIGRMLGEMINRAESFHGADSLIVQEDAELYLIPEFPQNAVQ